MHEICQRIWKSMKPGHFHIHRRLSIQTRYNGNIRIYYIPDFEVDHMLILTMTKYGGVVDAYASIEHGEKHDKVSKDEIEKTMHRVAEALNDDYLHHPGGPVWSNGNWMYV